LVGTIWQEALTLVHVGEEPREAVKETRNSFRDARKKQWSFGSAPPSLDIHEATTIGMFKGYCQEYLEKDLKKWHFVEYEREFHVKMPEGRIFTGFIDAIIEIKKGRFKGLWVLENKTASRIDDFHTKGASVAPQLIGYSHAASELFRQKFQGVIYFVTRKSGLRGRQGESKISLIKRVEEQYTEDPSSFFFRKYIRMSSQKIAAWVREFGIKAGHIEAARASKYPHAAFYMNQDFCFHYGQCPYFPLCKRGPTNTVLAFYEQRAV